MALLHFVRSFALPLSSQSLPLMMALVVFVPRLTASEIPLPRSGATAVFYHLSSWNAEEYYS